MHGIDTDKSNTVTYKELFEALPWLIYPLAVLAMAYVIVAIVLIRKALKNE